MAEERYGRRVTTLLDNFWEGELASLGQAEAEETWFELVLQPGDGREPVSRADAEAFAAPLAPLAGKLSPAPPDGWDPFLPPSPLLRKGPEVPVNVTTLGIQSDSSVAIGTDDGYMVVWFDESEQGVIRGRLFDAQGNPRTGELLVGGGPNAFWPQVAAAASGEYMTVWTQDGDLMGRVYAPDGQPLGAAFRIGSDAGGSQVSPKIVANAAGGFLVAWRDLGNIRTQRFGPQGNPLGQETVVDSARTNFGLAASPAGGYVIAWTEDAGGFLQSDVRARRLDALGQPLGAFLGVSTSSFTRQSGYKDHPVPVFHADGGFSILWTNYVYNTPGSPNPFGPRGLYARRFDAAGQVAGDVVTLKEDPSVADTAPAAVTLASGETLVVWYQQVQSLDPDGGLFGQVFDAGSWAPLSNPARINTYTADGQLDPALAVSPEGEVVATWSSGVDYLPILPPTGYGEGTQDGHFYGIFGQRFTLVPCGVEPGALCLGGRFRVQAYFTDPRTGQQGAAQAIPLTSDTGAFWFFENDNVELVLKVLDGGAVNGHFWVYYGALSDVQYSITVFDILTGRQKVYTNPRGRLASRADIEAFPVQ